MGVVKKASFSVGIVFLSVLLLATSLAVAHDAAASSGINESYDFNLLYEHIDDLETRIAELEQRQLQDESRLGLLEAWKLTVDELYSHFTELFFVLDLVDFNICSAIELTCGDVPVPEIECHTDNDCLGESSATCEGDVLRTRNYDPICVNPGSANSYCDKELTSDGSETCEFGCSDGACNPDSVTSVIFRTNVESGAYFTSKNTWIAVKTGADLEGYGQFGKANWNSGRCGVETLCDGTNIPCLVTKTPTNDPVVYYGIDTKLLVCDTTIRTQVFYDKNDPDAAAAVLLDQPTEPFASNNQEVYD